MYVSLLSRAFSRTLVNPNILFEVQRLTWAAIGGPLEAIIKATGTEGDLWDLIDKLRCPVEIQDDDGSLAWWGWGRKVEIYVARLKITVDLEWMSNRLQAAYVAIDAATGTIGERKTTAWVQDDESVAVYGTKEQQLTLADAADAEALAKVESVLDMLKAPISDIQFTNGIDEPYVILLCRGWWETLGWVLYTQTAGREAYDDTGTGLNKIGKGLTATNISFEHQVVGGDYYKIHSTNDNLLAFSANERIFITGSASNNGTFTISSVRDDDPGCHLIVNEAVVNESAGASVTLQTTSKTAQSFQLSSAVGWSAARIKVRIRREGTPADNIKLELCSNSAGSPGAVLASKTLTGATLEENLSWHEFELSSRVALSLATTYWIVLSRTGAIDASNYYVVDGNDGLGYGLGSCKVYTGAAWIAPSPDVDMLFIVIGEQETTEQIEDIITTAGQFLEGVKIENASGIWTPPYRTGERTALDYLNDLLLAGVSGGKRLLASVDRNRQVRIYQEPNLSAFDYLVSRDGDITDYLGNPVPSAQTPAGVWMRLKDVIPASITSGMTADPSKVFVDEIMWDAKTGRIHPRPRGQGRLTGLQGGAS